MGEFNYLISKYAHLADLLRVEARQHLLSILSFVYTIQGKYSQALDCCHKSLELAKFLPKIDHDLFLRQRNLLIVLYERVGKSELAITTAEQTLSTLS